jgi:uncharacterized membrane protein
MTMFMYFVGLAFYFILSTILWLLDPNPIQTLISCISFGVFLLTAIIFVTERMKRSLGKMVMELRGINKVITSLLNAGFIVIFLVNIGYMGQDKGTWTGYTWMGTLSIWIYISLFTGKFVMEDGLFCYGETIRWEEIQGYEWSKGFFLLNRNALQLKIWNKKSWTKPRLKTYVHKDQQDFVNNILKQKGFKQIN